MAYEDEDKGYVYKVCAHDLHFLLYKMPNLERMAFGKHKYHELIIASVSLPFRKFNLGKEG